MIRKKTFKEFCDELNKSKELSGVLTCNYHSKEVAVRNLSHLKRCRDAANFAIAKIEKFLE